MFGATTVRVPRARLATPEGKTTEWRNATIPAYQRRTKQADAFALRLVKRSLKRYTASVIATM
jgi:hypothetical protein